MKTKVVIFLLFFAVGVLANTPVGYNKWQIGKGRYFVKAGSKVDTYEKDGVFYNSDNTLINEGDSVYSCSTAIFKTRITNTGEARISINIDGNHYEVIQKPVKLVWLNVQNKRWTDVIPSLNWGVPIHDDSVVTWNFPGFDYSLINHNSRVQYQINYKKPFLDSAVVLFNQRNDSSRIALANVHSFTFVNIDDSTLLDIDETDFKVLKNIAFGRLHIGQQYLKYDSMDYDNHYYLKQRWVKENNQIYLVEYIMMGDMKEIHERYPNQNIYHNAEVDYAVSASHDDCEERALGIFLISTTEFIGDLGGNNFDNGFVFRNIQVPKNATINYMTFRVRASETRSDAVNINFYGEDVDSALTFTTQDNFNTRMGSLTSVVNETSWVNWTNGSWYHVGDSANLGATLEEVVARSGWKEGNAFSLILRNNGSSGYRRCYMWDASSGAYAPELYIDYTEAGGSQVIMVGDE